MVTSPADQRNVFLSQSSATQCKSLGVLPGLEGGGGDMKEASTTTTPLLLTVTTDQPVVT